MFSRLKDLVFGLGEFDKTRFDVRFDLIFAMLPSLKLKKLENFELLEESISKLKDLLRIKSSNLNKCIADSNKKLKKKDVVNLIEDLNKVKYEFLRKAFTLVERDEIGKFNDIIDSRNLNISGQFEQDSNSNESALDERDLFENLVFENNEFNVRLSNGKVPYLFFNFIGEVNLNILKEYEEILYEEYGAHGSNVVVEGNKVLLIPRFNKDNLFELPTIQVDIDELFEKLSKKNGEEILGESKSSLDGNVVEDVVDRVFKEEIDAPLAKDTRNREIHKNETFLDTNEISISGQSQASSDSDDGYFEVSKKAFVKKRGDDSLDELLSGDFKKSITHPNPKDDSSQPEIIEGEGIVFEKKDPVSKVSEIEIIRGQDTPENQNILDLQKNEILEQSKIISNSVKEEPEVEKKELVNVLDNFEHEIYRDDKVVIYLKERSQVLGEICLTPGNGSKMSELSESDLSYIMMFAKAFGGIVFESVEGHGTNLIFDYNDNVVRVVPRLQEDKLDNLNWNPIQLSEDELEGMKKKLVEAMLGGVKSSEESSKEISKNDDKVVETMTEVKEEFPVERIGSDEDEAKRKADFILESLHRIP